MKKLAYLALTMVILAVLASLSHAQTISPVWNECKVKCSGEFSVINNSVQPMTVTIEPHMFAFGADGKATMTPIDPAVVEVKLAETSARLSPQETHAFEYRVKCLKTPCMVTFLSGMVIGHTKEGMAVRLVLNSSLYVCDREKGCRAGLIPSDAVIAKLAKTEKGYADVTAGTRIHVDADGTVATTPVPPLPLPESK